MTKIAVTEDDLVGEAAAEGNGSSDVHEGTPVFGTAEVSPDGAVRLPLRKLGLRAFRKAFHIDSDCTAPACTIEGCGRPPRIRYSDWNVHEPSEVCCLRCFYNARNVDGDKVHTSECDALQLQNGELESAATEPAPGARRTDVPSTAMWLEPWSWVVRRPAAALFPGRKRPLTETERGITSKFPEVKGDGAMFMEDAEVEDTFKLAVRPFDADDVDRLGVNMSMMAVLNDFLFHAVNRLMYGSDELHGDPSPELAEDVERSRGMLQVALHIQAGTAGQNLLERHGYQGPWGTHDPGTTVADPSLALIEAGITPGPSIIEDTCARTYVGRTVIPTTDAQAHAAGLTIETAGNLSSYLMLTAGEFVTAADAALTHPSPATEAEKRRTLRRMHECISVQEGVMHYTALAAYAYHDAEGTQHFWFVPEDHAYDRHLFRHRTGYHRRLPGGDRRRRRA